MLNNSKIITAGLLVLSALTMRPAILGELFTKASMVIAVFAFIVYLVFRGVVRSSNAFHRNLVLALLSALFYVYLVLQAALLGIKHDSLIMVLQLAFSSVLLISTFGVLLANKDIHQIFFRALVWVCILEILSYLVTIVLLYVLEIDVDRLRFFHIQTMYEDRVGWVMFPLTLTYGTMNFGDLTLYRLGGAFREAGIFQAFITWAYFSLPYLKMDYRWVRGTLLVGLVCTMSTAGIAIFASCYLLRHFLLAQQSLAYRLRQPMVALVGGGIAAAIFLYMPVFGALEKMETREASISDRINATLEGVRFLLDNPAGNGMYNNPFENAGVNFISSLSLIGVIGALLFIALVAYSLISFATRYERRSFLIVIYPFLITGLLTQPFLDAPLVLIMLFQSYFMVHPQQQPGEGRLNSPVS